MRIFISLMLALTVLGSEPTITAQQRGYRLNRKAGQVVSVETRPDLAIEWQKAAKLKIATRKETFHVGEMININIAMINQSTNRVFFRSIAYPALSVTSDEGRSIAVVPYVIREFSSSPSLFELVLGGEFINESFDLLAGCDRRAFNQINSTAEGYELFDKNLFLNWGSSCLQIIRPGTYFITAEFKNNLVRTSSNPRIRSAVGTLKSSPIKVTIVE